MLYQNDTVYLCGQKSSQESQIIYIFIAYLHQLGYVTQIYLKLVYK